MYSMDNRFQFDQNTSLDSIDAHLIDEDDSEDDLNDDRNVAQTKKKTEKAKWTPEEVRKVY